MTQRNGISPETDLYIMMAFLNLGRTAKLRERVEMATKRAHFFGADSVQFDQIRSSLQQMEDFESAYGPGSCLNVEIPEVMEIVSKGSNQFDPVEIEAALRAPSQERVNILAWAA